jgi:hypothetical protein
VSRRRGVQAVAWLESVAVASFAVEEIRVARLLPQGVTPEVVVVDGRRAALVSAVSFVARGLRVPGVPFVGFDGGHVDYRTYVRHRGRPAVWFLGAAMHSRLAWALRGLWGMPWHRAGVDVLDDRGFYEVRVRNRRFSARLAVTDQPAPAALDGFASLADAQHLLVDPCLGLFRRGRGIRGYEVGHAPLLPRVVAGDGHVELFERLGLTLPGQRPHSVLRLPDFELRISLPPRRVR